VSPSGFITTTSTSEFQHRSSHQMVMGKTCTEYYTIQIRLLMVLEDDSWFV
jgi:hypothetical protein